MLAHARATWTRTRPFVHRPSPPSEFSSRSSHLRLYLKAQPPTPRALLFRSACCCRRSRVMHRVRLPRRLGACSRRQLLLEAVVVAIHRQSALAMLACPLQSLTSFASDPIFHVPVLGLGMPILNLPIVWHRSSMSGCKPVPAPVPVPVPVVYYLCPGHTTGLRPRAQSPKTRYVLA